MRILLPTLLMIFSIQTWSSIDNWACTLADGREFAIAWAGPNTQFLLNSQPLSCSIDGVQKAAKADSIRNSHDYRCKTNNNEHISIAKLEVNGNRAQVIFTHPEKNEGFRAVIGGNCQSGNCNG